MSAIPPEIARFRQKGTEIKCIRGHYYLQRVTSKWDKQARKVRIYVVRQAVSDRISVFDGDSGKWP